MDIEALRLLEADQRFQELNRYVPPLALIRAVGVARDELAHSRLLATLLDPRRHRGASAMLGVLLREIAGIAGLEGHIAERLRAIAEAPWGRVAVHRERLFVDVMGLIDVVVEIVSAEGAMVVGIENKVDAGERWEQIARYQNALGRAYPDRSAVVAFLTPTGREPTTANSDSQVPAVALGYDSILAAVEEARREAPPGSRDERVLGEVTAHLKEDILGHPEEAKRLVRALWRTHGQALRLALEHRPKLEDIRERYVKLLRERYGEDANISYWPERGELREIKMGLFSWYEKGFPFTFRLYVDEERIPRVRVMIYQDNYEPRAASLGSWARRVNTTAGAVIDENFTPLKGQGWWRKVLREEHSHPGAALDEVAFDEDTAQAAADAITVLVEQLRPHIDNK
jgi:PD-(D/E)XK nuclease superfamily